MASEPQKVLLDVKEEVCGSSAHPAPREKDLRGASEFYPLSCAGRLSETELLLGCSRVYLDPETAKRAKVLLRLDTDWMYLLRMAQAHGVMPLLYWHLSATSPDAVPKATLEQLRHQFHRNVVRNLFLTGELLRLLKLFEAHRLAAIPFKGPALAAQAYGNLALRQFSDLDLLLRQRDIPKARELLIAEGYRLDFNLTCAQEAAYLQSIGQLPFRSRHGSILVELHSRIVPRDFSFPLDTDELWERLEPICLADRKLLTLSPEDVLLILCVHGAKHLWTYLGGVCDVAELIRAHPAMNWARVLEQASLLRSERMLFLGLFLAIALLGASVPKQIEQRVLADRALALLATRVCQRLFRETGRPPGGLESSLFHLKARERLWDGVRYGLSLAMAPTVADWALVRVPPAFSFLYYLIRPMRLAGRYGRNLLKQLT